ncbi:MAG TPA: hypothetical protein VK446_05505 [Methylocystis sp.]|nr:hypothetical protein [Methylocystis sp.]
MKPSEYSRPVRGLLLLRYADGRFAELKKNCTRAPAVVSARPRPTPSRLRA